MKRTVYALSDPRSPICYRYVGISVHPNRRLVEHVSRARRGERNGPKDHWLRQLVSEDVAPKLTVLEVVQAEDSVAAERWWVRRLRDDQHDLLNVGPVGYSWTLERRQRHSRLLRGRKRSPETRARIAAGHVGFRGRRHSEETKKRIAQSVKAAHERS